MDLRAERVPRARAVLRAAALLPALLALACERGRDADPAAAAPRGASADAATLPARREAAARRGIEWLLAQRDAMQPEWAFSTFGYLVPIAPDEELAGRLREARNAAARTPFAALPEDFGDPALLEPARLRPLVAELLRRQRTGEPWQEAARALGPLLRAHVEELRSSTTAAQQAVLLHGCEELGIDPGWTLADSAGRLRQRWRTSDPEHLIAQAHFVFGLTHVLYAASRYFERYPNPEIFAPEAAMLGGALLYYLARPPPEERHLLDAQAEILVGLKLLRTTEGAEMRAMAERLLALQNADGSWGEPVGNHRYHATGVAVQALVAFPEQFRKR